MKKLLLALLLWSVAITAALSQQILDVTLVASGEGTTREEATKNALRSAVEQTYGTFISSNTTLLNDDLIRDEIVSISSGNVEKYEEISWSEATDGTTSVTLSVTVSLSKLTSYAKSKGSSAELAGNTFAMNMKLRKLNKESEKAALENLLTQVEKLSKDMYDFEMILGEPRIAGKDGLLYELRDAGYAITNKYAQNYLNKTTEVGYYVPTTIKVSTNSTTQVVYDLIDNTLLSLSLGEEELNYYKQHTIPYATIHITPTKNLKYNSWSHYYEQAGVKPMTYYLRSFEYAEEFTKQLIQILNRATLDYKVVASNNKSLSYRAATLEDNRPKSVFAEVNMTIAEDYYLDTKVFVHAEFYNKWVGRTDETVKVERIAEVYKDSRNDKEFDLGNNRTMGLLKTDVITLFVKEEEMMTLTGFELIP